MINNNYPKLRLSVWIVLSIVLCLAVLGFALFQIITNTINQSSDSSTLITNNTTPDDNKIINDSVDNSENLNNNEIIIAPENISTFEIENDPIITTTPDNPPVEQTPPSNEIKKVEITVQEVAETDNDSGITTAEPVVANIIEPIMTDIEEELKEEESNTELAQLESRMNDEIISIANAIGLTNRVKIIFYKTNPQIVDKETMEEICPGNDSAHATGCYFPSDNLIYVLEGANNIEAVFIHEILHAVWMHDKLYFESDFHQKLQDVYLNHSNRLREILNLYEEDSNFKTIDRYNELHSFIATNVPALPQDLEDYYQTILTNRHEYLQSYPTSNLSSTIRSGCSYDNNGITCTQLSYDIECGDKDLDGIIHFGCSVIDQSTKNKVNQLLCQSISDSTSEFNCNIENKFLRHCTIESVDIDRFKLTCTHHQNILNQLICLTDIETKEPIRIFCYNLTSANDLLSCIEQSQTELNCNMPENINLENIFIAMTFWDFGIKIRLNII